MKLVIDSEVCEKNNISLEEFLVLYLNSKDVKYKELLNSVIDKNLAGRNLFDEDSIILGTATKKLLSTMISDSCQVVKDNSKRIETLAETLRTLYIPGKKEGTQDYFKGSSRDITDKLKKFFIEYGNFTDEQIIEATKKYITSFNGDYRYAQLLKYFISKKVDGEKGSRLLSYIENAGQDDLGIENNNDWTTTLK